MTHVADVTIAAAQVTADHTNFPVYIDLYDLPADFWSTVANGGGDIRIFASDGTTERARDVVSCDTATDTGELHVLIPFLSSSSDTVIQIHADGTSSEPAFTDPVRGRNAVWADYEAVYHLNDSSGNLLDSTGAGQSIGTDVDTSYGLAGAVGDTVRSGPQTATFVDGSAISSMTVQTWAYQNAETAIGPVELLEVGAGLLEIFYHIGSDKYSLDTTVSAEIASTTTAPGNSETWNMLHGQLDSGTTARLFVNGSQEATTSASGSTASFPAGVVFFFDSSTQDITQDEIRFRRAALSADWIADEYTNQNTPTTFYTASSVGGGGTTVAATTEQIAVTANPANVSLGVSIAAALAQIDTTPHAASLSLGTAISGNSGQIRVTRNPAVVSMGTAIGAAVQSIAVTVHPSDLSSGSSITGDVQQIAVNALAASVSAGTSLSAALAGIELAPHSSTVVVGDAIAAAAQQIAVDPHAATVELSITMQGSLHQIGVEALAASVGLGSQVDAVAQNITLTPHGATLDLATTVSANALSIDVTTFRATVDAGVAPITVPGLEYTLPVSRIHFTFTEED